jgi:hypothetical protein
MNLNNVLVADIECRGLLDDLHGPEDFHVLSVGWKSGGEWKIKSTNKEEDVRKLFGNPENTIIMHNGIRYDKPAIQKMFGFKVEAVIVDSLALSWWFFYARHSQGKRFGLEAFGEDYGVPKPKIEDWSNLTYDEYKFRCQEDVSINILLWEDLYKKMTLMYEGKEKDLYRLVKILNWIMECSHRQEVTGIKLYVEKALETLAYFEGLKEEKIGFLTEAMPSVPVKKVVSFPKKGLYKKDGTLSEAGKKYLGYLSAIGLSDDYTGDLEIITAYLPANPNSVTQKKQWLYSLDWEPATFKHNRNKETNEVKVVEQIMTDDKMLCPSVLKLAEKEPAIMHLDSMTVLTHRIGILKGLLNNRDENDMVHQGLSSLAISMRWQHSLIVNYPKYTGKGDLRDGKWIRDCLIAGDGKKIVQSDLSGIESRTSDHYTMPINPDRIKRTQMPYYDPHTEISVSSRLMTKDEEVFFIFKSAHKEDNTLDVDTFSELYKPTEKVYELLALPEEEQNKLIKHLKQVRSKGKTCNYSSLYLVGSETLSRTLEISKSEAQELIDAFWKIHYAVLEVSESFEIKKVGNEEWVLNPISKWYYPLKSRRNIFSVVNQSSAVYCFNMWVWNCNQLGIYPVTQNHDDSVYIVDEDKAVETTELIEKAMDRVNAQLGLRVKLACETQIGDNLSETH